MRSYTSGTAQWCWHPHRGWVVGDESSTLSTHVNGRDLPLMTTMGAGNESDFTNSPRTGDEFLKMCREHGLPFHLDILVGDGHYDTLPFYRYLKQQAILSVIPLKGTDFEALRGPVRRTHPGRAQQRGRRQVSPGSLHPARAVRPDPADPGECRETRAQSLDGAHKDDVRTRPLPADP